MLALPFAAAKRGDSKTPTVLLKRVAGERRSEFWDFVS